MPKRSVILPRAATGWSPTFLGNAHIIVKSGTLSRHFAGLAASAAGKCEPTDASALSKGCAYNGLQRICTGFHRRVV